MRERGKPRKTEIVCVIMLVCDSICTSHYVSPSLHSLSDLIHSPSFISSSPPSEMDFEGLAAGRIIPPWTPTVVGSMDTSQFDMEFTSMLPIGERDRLMTDI